MTGWVRTAWRGMGPWKWLGIAAIVTVVVLTPVTAQGSTGTRVGTSAQGPPQAGKLGPSD